MDSRTLLEQVANWAAIRTAARWEKAIAEQLASVGVPTYLPLMTRVSVSRSKRQTASVPLFPGYLFCGHAEVRACKRIPMACTAKIAQLLAPPDPDRLREELLAVAALLNDRQLVQERVFGTVGETVRLTGGPLAGHLGKILRFIPGSSRVVLEISFLGSRVEATLEDRSVEKARHAI